MASGNYSSEFLPQEPAQIVIPLRASATRQLPVVEQQEERKTRKLPVLPAAPTLPVRHKYAANLVVKESPTIKIQHVVGEFRENSLAYLPGHLPWLRPFVLCLLGVVVLFFVLISAGVFQRPVGPSNLVYSPNAQSYPIQVGGSISAINTWQNSNGPISSLTPIPTHSGPYSVIGKPTIAVDFINRVLATYNSPAAGKGQALYDLGVKYGIDPAFALAFFMHESTFGTAGMATVTLSLGNLRCIPSVPCNNGYAQFSSWEQGFEAWYKLIRNLYVAQWGLVTIDQIIPTYAPSSDHNNVSGYIAALKHTIDTWHAGIVQVS